MHEILLSYHNMGLTWERELEGQLVDLKRGVSGFYAVMFQDFSPTWGQGAPAGPRVGLKIWEGGFVKVCFYYIRTLVLTICSFLSIVIIPRIFVEHRISIIVKRFRNHCRAVPWIMRMNWPCCKIKAVHWWRSGLGQRSKYAKYYWVRRRCLQHYALTQKLTKVAEVSWNYIYIYT